MPIVAPAPSPVAPHLATPMAPHHPFDSVPMPAARIPSAPPAPAGPLGREMTTAPRAFVPPKPRSGAQAATVLVRNAGGGPSSTGLKMAIAAGGLIAVLLVFGVLILGKMVFRTVAASHVETTTQTSTMSPAAAPVAAPGTGAITTQRRDPVVVPLDAATGTP